eukprot:scaffold13044_cov64-Skeletonema_marinoi.AAC.1
MTRHLHSTTSSSSNNGNTKRGSTKKRYATTALIASATASVSYAGYFFFSSAAIPAVSGESVTEDTDAKRKTAVFKEQLSSDPTFGYEYVGFDSYPGIELDDGTGVATAELKAASVKAYAHTSAPHVRWEHFSGYNINGIPTNGPKSLKRAST